MAARSPVPSARRIGAIRRPSTISANSRNRARSRESRGASTRAKVIPNHRGYSMTLKAFLAGTVFALAATSLVYAAGGDPLAPIGLTDKQPVAPVKPVTETLFGTPITDNYRYMENMDADTVAYLKAQGAYTRKVFDAI